MEPDHIRKFLPERIARNMSSLVAISSSASYRSSSVSFLVSGCSMLLLSSLEPMGVSVWFSKPKRQSLDLAFCRFCISSKDLIVERSIIIDPSEGSYLIRIE